MSFDLQSFSNALKVKALLNIGNVIECSKAVIDDDGKATFTIKLSTEEILKVTIEECEVKK